MTEMPTVTVGHRFRGPARSGNGGYTAGLLAERLLDATGRLDHSRAVRVRLHTPPPLDRALEIDVDAGAGTATMRDGATTVATAGVAGFDRDAVPPVPAETAAAAGPYPGQTDHPFPGCFVCGTDRAEGDGMRIFPGRLGQGRTACTWTPDASVGAQSVDASPVRCHRRSCGPRWTARAGGRRTSVVGRWCSGR